MTQVGGNGIGGIKLYRIGKPSSETDPPYGAIRDCDLPESQNVISVQVQVDGKRLVLH